LDIVCDDGDDNTIDYCDNVNGCVVKLKSDLGVSDVDALAYEY